MKKIGIDSSSLAKWNYHNSTARDKIKDILDAEILYD